MRDRMPTVRVAGHFGEWLQGRLGPDGPLVLVTLPCAALGVRPDPDGAEILPAAVRARFARALGRDLPPLPLAADMPPGGGAGASTAALLALARAARAPHDADALARACLAAEGATDPLMHPRPDRLLWAPREARALRSLPPVPEAEIVGGFWGPPEATAPGDLNFPDIADLVAAWEEAPNLAARARLAARSAARTDALRGPRGDPTPGLARDFGALGRVRAHTGSARGLVFAPGTVPDGAEAALAAAGLTGILRFSTGGAA